MSLALRRTTERDLDFVCAAETSEDNRAFVSVWTREQHINELYDEDIAHLIIEKDDRRVGYLIVAGLSNEHQSVEFRRLVVTEKGSGIGREVFRLVKRMAFEEFGAHRLWLDVKEFNKRAISLYESEGFIVEGVMRECMKNGDEWESFILMSMLRHEYEAKSKAANRI
nr:acetyltransferase (GNAT) domain protein [uncultured bacterium]